MSKKKSPQFIPLGRLDGPDGERIQQREGFQEEGESRTKKVRSIYPGLKIGDVKGGFILHPGPTAVAPAIRQKKMVKIPDVWWYCSNNVKFPEYQFIFTSRPIKLITPTLSYVDIRLSVK